MRQPREHGVRNFRWRGRALADAAEAATSYPELVRRWSNYTQWLYSSQLSELPRNRKVLNENGDDGHFIMSVAVHGAITPLARKVADVIRNTELPSDS